MLCATVCSISMLQIVVLKEVIAKEDGDGGLAKPDQDCFGVMLSTTVPRPTIARNMVLRIATGGRCISKLL